MLKKAFIRNKTKKNRNWKFRYFGLICSVLHFHPTRNTGGQEKINYELRVSFCNSPICWKKTNNWGFQIDYRYLNMLRNLDNILIIVIKWKYYRFRPTLKSFCDYFKSGCAFHKIQIITTKRIVVFVFNYNIVHA